MNRRLIILGAGAAAFAAGVALWLTRGPSTPADAFAAALRHETQLDDDIDDALRLIPPDLDRSLDLDDRIRAALARIERGEVELDF